MGERFLSLAFLLNIPLSRTGIALSCLWLWVTPPLSAQEPPPGTSTDYLQEERQPSQLDENRWHDLVQDLDYTTRERKKREPDNDDDEGKTKDKTAQREAFLKNAGPVTKFLALLLLALTIGVIAYFWWWRRRRHNPTTSVPGLGLTIEELEADLPATNLQDYIRQAIERGDYALAIRLYYLEALRRLSAQAFIRWQRERTNHDYLRDLRGGPYYADFYTLTLIFERVRYGGQPLSRETFQEVEPLFDHFLTLLPASLAAQTSRT